MLVIYEGSNQWVKRTKLETTLAVVGTAQEMELPDIKSDIQWSVSLPNGHPAWGENFSWMTPPKGN